MTLTDIVDFLMVQSGQYILQSFDKTLLSYDQLWLRIVKPELINYQKYKPVIKSFNLNLNSTHHRFDDESAPEWISNVKPLEGTRSSILTIFQSATFSNLTVPHQLVWKYDKPNFYCQYNGAYEITGCYKYPLTITKDDENKITEVDIENLDYELSFLNLVLGKFLIALGKSRRSFTINDLPITMDSDSVVSEGTEIYENAKESLYEKSYWWKAIGD